MYPKNLKLIKGLVVSEKIKEMARNLYEKEWYGCPEWVSSKYLEKDSYVSGFLSGHQSAIDNASEGHDEAWLNFIGGDHEGPYAILDERFYHGYISGGLSAQKEIDELKDTDFSKRNETLSYLLNKQCDTINQLKEDLEFIECILSGVNYESIGRSLEEWYKEIKKRHFDGN